MAELMSMAIAVEEPFDAERAHGLRHPSPFLVGVVAAVLLAIPMWVAVILAVRAV
jgi:hypothetical protein